MPLIINLQCSFLFSNHKLNSVFVETLQLLFAQMHTFLSYLNVQILRNATNGKTNHFVKLFKCFPWSWIVFRKVFLVVLFSFDFRHQICPVHVQQILSWQKHSLTECVKFNTHLLHKNVTQIEKSDEKDIPQSKSVTCNNKLYFCSCIFETKVLTEKYA